MDASVVRAHGLTIESALSLDAMAAPAGSAVDLTIDLASEPILGHGPSQPVLSYDYDNGQSVRAERMADDTIVLSISDVARFRLSPKLDRIDVEVIDPDQLELTRVLTQGWVVSTTLMLRGHTILHASAVEVDGQCLVFLADSGMGKSTTTALMIRDGAAMVSDDVLRVEVVDGQAIAYPGATAIRLRSSAHALIDELTERGGRALETSDGRVAVTFDATTQPLPIRAIVVPLPARESHTLSAQWLDPNLAVVELNSYPRVFDWHIHDPVRRHFETSIEIASTTPVGLLDVPWGPPWTRGLLGSLTDAVSAATASSGRDETGP